MYLFTQSSWRLKILGLGNVLFSIISLACANEVFDWEKSRQIKTAFIKDSPALALFKDKLYLAYQSAEKKSAQLQYAATEDGNNWDPGQPIRDIIMEGCAALAEFNDKLYLVYQSAEKKSAQLWYTATEDGNNWDPGQPIRDIIMEGSAALASFRNKLYLAYQARNSKQLYYTITKDGQKWTNPKPIKNIAMLRSPALARFNDKLYVVYQDCSGWGYLYYTTTYDGKNWAEPKQISDIRLSYSPALAVFDDKLYLAHQGKGKSGGLWYTSTSDGENWDKKENNPVKESNFFFINMSCSPALAGFGDKLYVAYQGSVKNGNLWFAKAGIKGFLRVSLKDFVFDSPLSDLDKYLAENKDKLLEMASTQRLNIEDNDLSVNVSNIYERSIQETFSWGLNQKFNTQVSTKFQCGLKCIADASQSIDVSASFEVGAHQDWSTSRIKKFTVTAGMAPKESGMYELGLRVYCVKDMDLPFTAIAKLTATTGIYGEKDAVHQTDRKLNAEIVEALFKNSGGVMTEIIEKNQEKRYIKSKMAGTMKATYGVLQEVIARKIKPIEKPVEVTGETRNEVKNMGANKRVNKINAKRGNRGRNTGKKRGN
ncbi:MAG: hypothetical protein K0M45_03385 [Candidatus Paracaedibacteraceae bacterium]|nr:hypothetical protein [Candidatus Paracaedibacteraceae bacterium]